MAKFKIIADSSADLNALEGIRFSSVPLKIVTSEKEYVDNETLDTHAMLDELAKYKGRSGSSCPNTEEWKNAFEDAENVFCVTITSNLSGSCNAARTAVREYTEEHPERHGHVVDTLSTGPESALIIEKLRELILEGHDFDTIVERIHEYKRHTHLIFALESLHNLANNGRVSPLVAKISGVLGIRVVGVASLKGTLELTNKSRGVKGAIEDIMKIIKSNGFHGGRMKIHHAENLPLAEKIRELALSLYPLSRIEIAQTRGLCSFYAERGGVLIGFEGAAKAEAAE